MANKGYQKQHRYRLIDQKIALLQNYPEAECNIRHGTLTWKGAVQPTALSRLYQVTVTYKIGFRPQVSVTGDELPGLDRPDFPHRFTIDRKNQTVNICLHLGHEFDSTHLVAECIIPWAVEWLYYYELWLTTGKWCGGGTHPGRPIE